MIFVVTEISTGKEVQGPRNLINGLFWWQGDHCCDARASERDRKQLPKEYQE